MDTKELSAHEAALKEIVRLSSNWAANQMGGIAHQRKRWKKLASIAAKALREKPAQKIGTEELLQELAERGHHVKFSPLR